MNNTFSLRRVLLYARKHYVENSRNYLYLLSGFLLLLTILAWFNGVHRQQPDDFMGFSFFLRIVFLCLVTRLSCHSHYAPAQMGFAYTLPATALEKYLFIWFNSTIVSTVLFSVVMLPTTFIAGVPCNSVIEMPFFYFWLMILFIQSGFMLSCCWVKGNPLKVLLPLVCIVIFALWGYDKIHDTHWGQWTTISQIFDRGWVSMNSVTAGLSYRIREYPINKVYMGFIGYWTLVCWVVAYFKFKERTLK